MALPALAVLFYLPVVIEDAMLFESVSQQRGCCGFVSENLLERPVTYALVDEWTQPVWTQNAMKSENWLTSDGKINGETKFWRIIERKPVE